MSCLFYFNGSYLYYLLEYVLINMNILFINLIMVNHYYIYTYIL